MRDFVARGGVLARSCGLEYDARRTLGRVFRHSFASNLYQEVRIDALVLQDPKEKSAESVIGEERVCGW